MVSSYANKLISLVRQPADYNIGLLSYRKGRWDEAEALFRKAVKKSPHHAPSHFKLGMCRFRQGAWAEAKQHMEEALRRDPSRNEWNKQLQQALRHLKSGAVSTSAESEAQIRRNLEQAPDNPEHQIALAAHYKRRGKRPLEIEALEAAISLGARTFAVQFARGDALEAMRRFKAAAAAYAEAAKLDPKSAEAWYRQGYALERTGHDGPADCQAALACYSKAIACDKAVQAKRFGIGAFHEKRGHWKAAAEAYQRHLPTSPADPELLYRLGLAHDRCYEWGEAEQAYMRALASDPSKARWHARLGFVRERQGHFVEAWMAYRYADELAPDPECRYRAVVCLGKALGAERAMNYLLECHALPAIDKQPATDVEAAPGADSDWSVEYTRSLRQYGAARLQKEVRAFPQQAQGWEAIGRLLEEDGQFAEAAENYLHAIRRGQAHAPELHVRRSLCLAKSGRATEALDAYFASRKLPTAYGTMSEEYKKDSGFRIRADYAEYLETLELDSAVVLYESFHGASISCNPFALYLALQERVEHQGLFHVWAVNDGCEIPPEVLQASNVAVVRRGTDAYIRYLATAGTLINNVSFPDYFVRRDGQRYLNTWHGTPIKFLGKDIKDDFLAHKNVARNFLNATHLISQNAYTTDILLSRYDVKDTFVGEVLESGYPRVDRTLGCPETEIAKIRARLGCREGEKLILYAPTWRGLHGHAKLDEEALLADIEAMRRCGHRIVLRGHHMVEHVVRALPAGDIVVPADIDSNVLLAAADALVTDYSSIAFDYLVTRRPIIHYAYDLAEYERERGLYFPLAEMPGQVVYERESLAQALESLTFEAHDRHEQAISRFCPHDDGRAADRVIDRLFEVAQRQPEKPRSGKRTILFYVGAFIPNGILTSFLNLVRSLPASDYSITIAVDPEAVTSSDDRLEQIRKLPDHVALIGRVGPRVATVEEAWIAGKFRALNALPSQEMFDLMARSYRREFRRIFGDSQFDAVVHFEGYNVDWIPIFAFADERNARRRVLYQHNEMESEWRERFPYLQSVFHLARYFSQLLSVSEQTRVLNAECIGGGFGVPRSLFGLAHNVQDAAYVAQRAQETTADPVLARLSSGKHRVFITLGRLSAEKDHAKLITAFSRVAATVPDAMLVILGDGPLRANLEAQIAYLGLGKRVHLPGRIDNPFPWLARADCFVLSSNYEGQPMVLLEAMSLGKPIIATRIPGCVSVLGDEYGLLVDNSAQGVEDGLRAFLEGRVRAGAFNVDEYNLEALRMFEAGALGITH